jgi:hypothetical protein
MSSSAVEQRRLYYGFGVVGRPPAPGFGAYYLDLGDDTLSQWDGVGWETVGGGADMGGSALSDKDPVVPPFVGANRAAAGSRGFGSFGGFGGAQSHGGGSVAPAPTLPGDPGLTTAAPVGGGGGNVFKGASITGGVGTNTDGNSNFFQVTLDTVEADSSNFADVANNRVVIREAGDYRITADGSHQQGGVKTPTLVDLRILVNGVAVKLMETCFVSDPGFDGISLVVETVQKGMTVGQHVTVEVANGNAISAGGTLGLAGLRVVQL